MINVKKIVDSINAKKLFKGLKMLFLNPHEFKRWSYHYMHALDSPIIIYTEVTTHCNNRCVFCVENKINRKGFIKDEVRDRVADLVSRNPHRSFKIYFHLLGEPLLYDRLYDYIKLLSFKNAELWISTNGTCLDNEKIQKLRSAGLENVWFSMFYTNETEYNKNTRSDNYLKARESLYNLISKNKLFKRIHIVTFSERAEEIERAIRNKINITLKNGRTISDWKYELKHVEKQICVSINGDVTFSYKDYNFRDSIGDICKLDSETIMREYCKVKTEKECESCSEAGSKK